jgi:hypothetical protein
MVRCAWCGSSQGKCPREKPLESEVIATESRLVRQRAIGKGWETIPHWWPLQPHVRFWSRSGRSDPLAYRDQDRTARPPAVPSFLLSSCRLVATPSTRRMGCKTGRLWACLFRQARMASTVHLVPVLAESSSIPISQEVISGW